MALQDLYLYWLQIKWPEIMMTESSLLGEYPGLPLKTRASVLHSAGRYPAIDSYSSTYCMHVESLPLRHQRGSYSQRVHTILHINDALAEWPFPENSERPFNAAMGLFSSLYLPLLISLLIRSHLWAVTGWMYGVESNGLDVLNPERDFDMDASRLAPSIYTFAKLTQSENFWWS